MLSPNDCRVNEAWIVAKINNIPLLVQNDEYDVYVLLDAGSTYVFGQALSQVDGSATVDEVAVLFDIAWKAKQQWPEKIMVTDNSNTSAVFEAQAKRIGLPVIHMPMTDIEPIVGELISLFNSQFKGK